MILFLLYIINVESRNKLKKIIFKINEVELLCKTKPQVSKVIFFNFFLEVFIKANNSS